jgi:hypothetical protein
MRALAIAVPLALLLASTCARAEDAVAVAGKQRALSSSLDWDIREAGHPILGSVRFAYLKSPVVTPVGISRVYSNVYVSCAANGHTMAFELTNQAAPDDPGGLKPAAPPLLICKSPAAKGTQGTVQDPIAAEWHLTEVGDALAYGYLPHKLRACSTIAIVQEVALPKGWSQRTAAVQIEITPYSKALDSIFTTCGEASAYASPPRAPVPVASTRPPAPVAAPPVAPPPPAPPQAPVEPAWIVARTTSAGRTNVRAEPNTHSAIVAKLDPGAVIFVQHAGGDWYRAKARNGPKFEGYIRDDRLVVK